MNPASTVRRSVLLCVLLTAVTVAIYWPVAHHEFLYFDDATYVTDNPHVQAGLTAPTAKWAFTTGHAGNWHPLTWLSHALDCQFFGLQAGAHHLVNLLFHTANTLLLFALLRRMTRAFWRSALVAALFALHPLHVESVAWIAERKDVLSTFFGFLTLWAYAQFVEQSKVQSPKSKVWYSAALLCFALGLMSKPMLVTWPFVLLLLDYWPLRRFEPSTFNIQHSTFARLVLEKLPFFALSIAASIVTFLVQRHEGAMQSVHAPFEARLANAVLSYFRYLQKTVWPVDLSILYPHPAISGSPAGNWLSWEMVLAMLVMVGFSVLALRWAKQKPYVIVGWFWFLGTLIPVIGLVQVGEQAMADRYSYIPLIGIFIAVSWWLGDGREARGQKSEARSQTSDLRPQTSDFQPLTSGFCLCASGAALIALAILSSRQVRYWKDNLTLFTHALVVTPANATAHFNCGAALDAQGNVAAAMEHYRQAIAVNPTHANAHYNLAQALANQGRRAEAETEYRATLKLQPDLVEAHNNFGLLLQAAGKLAEAQTHYEAALRWQPNAAIPRANLAGLLADQGKFAEAAAHYREVVRLHPDVLEFRTKLGSALAAANQRAEAEAQFHEAIRLHPDAQTHLNLGRVLLLQGKPAAAAVEYEAAILLNPDSPQALNDLAWLRATHPDAGIRDGAKAVRLAEHACELRREDARCWDTLGAAYAEAGQFEEAIRAAEKARQLAQSNNQTKLVPSIEAALALYQKRQPYRQQSQ